MNVDNLPFFKTGLVIAVLNLLAILNAAKYFLLQAKFPVPAWLMFNVCVPSVVIFLTGFFTRQHWIMAASIPFMAFFGIGGLFVFGWTSYTLISQIGHMLMTLAVAYIIVIIIIGKNWQSSITGFIIGLVLLFILLPFQQRYVKSHPEYIRKLGDPAFEERMKQR